jgi:hypothetical protein
LSDKKHGPTRHLAANHLFEDCLLENKVLVVMVHAARQIQKLFNFAETVNVRAARNQCASIATRDLGNEIKILETANGIPPEDANREIHPRYLFFNELHGAWACRDTEFDFSIQRVTDEVSHGSISAASEPL